MTKKDITRNKKHLFAGLQRVADGAVEAVPAGLTLACHFGSQTLAKTQRRLSTLAEELNRQTAEQKHR